MSLGELVREAFAPAGMLSRAISGFTPRQAQSDMAQAVSAAIEERGVLVVEAGTGVGKTYAYLVPALLSGCRVLISTATKTLQDQLHGRDLPRLIDATGVPVRRALLKGRSSYLCLHRMELARHEIGSGDRARAATLARVETWAQSTRTGDLAEIPGLDERSPVIPLVTSTRENCLGGDCPQWKACHVNLARREAMAADVVVINHHLFFADMAVRESGVAELLPSVDVAVFDEAHQLNETGVQFLGRHLGTAQLIDFARDLLAAGLQWARGLVDWSALASQCELSARDLRLVVGRQGAGARLRWLQSAPEGIEPQQWSPALDRVSQACTHCVDALDTVSELAPDFDRLRERANAFIELVNLFRMPAPADAVRWVDVGAQLRLVESPLDIAQTVRERLLGDSATAGRAWVFTSATLGDDDKLSWFTGPCGLDEARVLRLGSPFDYAAQAALYVPRDLPRPNEPGHTRAVAELAARAASSLRGRTLVLTTTLRALREISAHLADVLASDGIAVLAQGEATKRELIDRFRAGAREGAAGCVLVASASFWEGVDLPGEDLQLVIIDKLPFPPPNDPLVEARSRRIEQQGASPFNAYFVPEAAVALKQGAGRLIRTETDRGVLVVCDPRLVTMGYGRRLLAALPPMSRVDEEAQLLLRLRELAQPHAG